MKPLEALRALGSGSDAPVDAKQRVYGALLASLEGAAAGAAGGAKASAAASTTATANAATGLVGMTSSKALLIGAGLWLIGGATGAALYGAFQHERVRVVYVDRPVAMSSAPISSAVAPAPGASANVEPRSLTVSASASAPHAIVAAPAASSMRNAGSALAQERAMLDVARAAAARGEPARALEQTEQHRLQFPQGRLAEEREALAIRALLALGRGTEAHTRADAFRAAYPNSFLTPVIDSALSAP